MELPICELSPRVKMRTMRNGDLEVVVRNEADASHQHPWSRRVFVDCLRAGYQCWVLINDDAIIGHGVVSVAIGESHLLTLCVHPDFQRLGHGKRMLRFLLERAQREDAQICYLEVRRSNLGAISLYKTMGFVPIGERKNYYPDEGHDREDALIMSLTLPA